MNANESERFARKSAVNITDALSRAGLAEKFREAAAICAGAQDGLRIAADDLGVCVDSGIEANLKLAMTILAEVAEQIAAATVFVTCAERDEIEEDRLTRHAEYERNPMYAVTRNQLDQYAAQAIDFALRDVVTA
ncbi:hypothetical protein ABT369_39080 [Dactylosporangium sp. NPDC000244]|uniref:hypothetical protein n=1 Tax=Dactylosporangium sp. NPDC000244 TaxID=3154365 RepID=UPI003332C9B0